VVRTKAYAPNQKLIERAFRDLKDHLRYFTNTHPSFEEALKAAIDTYNRTEHRFEHFNEPVVPEILHSGIEYRTVEEDELRKAFREKFIRVVRNHTITIENLKYEFIYDFEERAGEIGRNRKAPTVVCYRDIENAAILEVWDEKETRPLGIARLISTDAPSLDPTEIREIKNKEKRIERRRQKIKQELIQIEQQEQELQELAKTAHNNFFRTLVCYTKLATSSTSTRGRAGSNKTLFRRGRAMTHAEQVLTTTIQRLKKAPYGAGYALARYRVGQVGDRQNRLRTEDGKA